MDLPRSAAAPLLSLDWLVGHWRATVPGTPNDCAVPVFAQESDLVLLPAVRGAMAGLWRLGTSLSLISVREVRGELEWHDREFDSKLQPHSSSPEHRYALVSNVPGEAVLESRGDSGHPRIQQIRMSFSRTSKDLITVRFQTPAENGGWVTAREADHHRAGTGADLVAGGAEDTSAISGR